MGEGIQRLRGASSRARARAYHVSRDVLGPTYGLPIFRPGGQISRLSESASSRDLNVRRFTSGDGATSVTTISNDRRLQHQHLNVDFIALPEMCASTQKPSFLYCSATIDLDRCMRHSPSVTGFSHQASQDTYLLHAVNRRLSHVSTSGGATQ